MQKIGLINLIMIKKYILIVASVSLATIVSCSSVKKNKTITEVKEDIKEVRENSTTTKEQSTNNAVADYKMSAEKKRLEIGYEPTFDANGLLIPFSFKGKDANGNETTVDIKGSASVKYFTDSQVIDEVKYLKEELSKIKDSLSKSTIVKDSTITTKEKTKEVAPDYIKYIIWLGILILFLSGVILFLYFYFRSKIKAVTKLIPF